MNTDEKQRLINVAKDRVTLVIECYNKQLTSPSCDRTAFDKETIFFHALLTLVLSLCMTATLVVFPVFTPDIMTLRYLPFVWFREALIITPLIVMMFAHDRTMLEALFRSVDRIDTYNGEIMGRFIYGNPERAALVLRSRQPNPINIEPLATDSSNAFTEHVWCDMKIIRNVDSLSPQSKDFFDAFCTRLITSLMHRSVS